MPTSLPHTTAIIGAGIAGLACARALHDAGRRVVLFDKARGPGGRMSSRRLPGAVVDLGAQFFSVRDDAFRRQVETWRAAGRAAPWPEALWQADEGGWRRHRDGRERFIGSPRMSAVTRQLADGLDLIGETRIVRLERQAAQWWLVDQGETRHGPFDRVVVAVPSSQAGPLVEPHDPALAAACEAVIQRPCWAAWALLDSPLPSLPGVDDAWQAVQVRQGPLRFVSRNDHKPGRADQGESLTLLAHLDWSQARLEADTDEVARQLLAAFAAVLPAGSEMPRPRSLGAHRWRFAQPDVFARGEAVNRDHRLGSDGLALCGDGWRGPRVEDAWLSGHHLGGTLVAIDA
ncbi:NAD(P)/FAD-dependent oxidoreductase [Halomonas heilongjiangensis]|uniref:Amine oxidase n=1 Tax=Halomonas heilongjiangensis TaxID=1387883 RepID=A0A2N7TRV5_9GAMM|nr:FAD-dependent oxidoreductase [Halomonas heilongjiangensis]PMR70917.1 amine oxidase [Halomonas heilongjiangensis]PXX88269.1 amine oxidase [Halomonas heilongjiangensis]